jgi:hypothetical protein
MIALALAAGFVTGFWFAVCLPEVKRAWRMAREKKAHEKALEKIRRIPDQGTFGYPDPD